MTDAFLAFAKEFGPAVAVCTGVAAFLLWWVRQQIDRWHDAAEEREKYLNKRLDEVQDMRMKDFQDFNARLLEVVANNTQAFQMLKQTILEWQARPCLAEPKDDAKGKKAPETCDKPLAGKKCGGSKKAATSG